MNLFQLMRVLHNAGFSRNQNERYAGNRRILFCQILLENIGIKLYRRMLEISPKQTLNADAPAP